MLDLPSGSTGNGTQIIQEVYDYFPTQDWQLFPASIGVDIHGQPSNAVVGQPISPAITVAVVDAKGNTITTNNTQLVTLAIASGPRAPNCWERRPSARSTAWRTSRTSV